jgi:hypothetical protein
MAKLNIQKLTKRIQAAEGVKMEYRSLFEGAYELALPQRNLYSTRSQGSSKMDKVFDSTGIAGINGFVNRIMTALTPPFVKWAELKAGPAIPQGSREEVNKILEVITDIVFSTINSSNFSIAAGEMYYDLAVGTGAMLILEGDDEQPIKFISVPTSEIALDEGENGFIAGIFRNHKVAGRGVLQTWRDAKLTPELAKMVQDCPDKEIEFKEVTYYDDEEKIWRYEILFNKTDRIVERTFEVNPWVIVRWSKVAGEVYGRGPLLQALPDLKMLNKARELAIRSAQLNIFGVYTVADDGVTNPDTIKIAPNAMIPVSRNAGPNGPSIAPLPRTGDLNAQNFMFEELRQQINTLLLNDRLPPDAGPVRSATEIVERMKQLQVDTGAAFGRLIFEFVQKLLQRVIHILENKDIITFGGGIKIDNINVTTQILSPLAKTQGIEDVNSVVNSDQILKGIDPTGQLSQLTFNIDNLGAWVADKLGVSPSLIRTEEERENIKQQAAQVVAAQQEAGAVQ